MSFWKDTFKDQLRKMGMSDLPEEDFGPMRETFEKFGGSWEGLVKSSVEDWETLRQVCVAYAKAKKSKDGKGKAKAPAKD